jgi:DNA anti-recombination protein RmuC
MTISSFPPISILAKWNSIKEDAREFFSSLQRNSLNSTRKPHVFLLNTLREAMREMHERSFSSTFTNGDESWMRLVGLL